MKTVYRIYCEWDIGNEDIVFTTEAKAKKWCEENESLTEMCGPGQDFESLDEIFDAGLLGFRDVDLI